MKNYIKAVFLIIVLLFLVTFGIKNNQLLRLNYYFEWHTIDFPLYILAYASIIIGIFIGMLIGINSRFQQRRKIKILEKDKEINKQIEKFANRIASGELNSSNTLIPFCNICKNIRKSKILCKIHKKAFPELKNCNICFD